MDEDEDNHHSFQRNTNENDLSYAMYDDEKIYDQSWDSMIEQSSPSREIIYNNYKKWGAQKNKMNLIYENSKDDLDDDNDEEIFEESFPIMYNNLFDKEYISDADRIGHNKSNSNIIDVNIERIKNQNEIEKYMIYNLSTNSDNISNEPILTLQNNKHNINKYKDICPLIIFNSGETSTRNEKKDTSTKQLYNQDTSDHLYCSLNQIKENDFRIHNTHGNYQKHNGQKEEHKQEKENDRQYDDNSNFQKHPFHQKSLASKLFYFGRSETVLTVEQKYTFQKMISVDMFGVEDLGVRIRFILLNNLGNLTRKDKNHMYYLLNTTPFLFQKLTEEIDKILLQSEDVGLTRRRRITDLDRAQLLKQEHVQEIFRLVSNLVFNSKWTNSIFSNGSKKRTATYYNKTCVQHPHRSSFLSKFFLRRVRSFPGSINNKTKRLQTASRMQHGNMNSTEISKNNLGCILKDFEEQDTSSISGNDDFHVRTMTENHFLDSTLKRKSVLEKKSQIDIYLWKHYVSVKKYFITENTKPAFLCKLVRIIISKFLKYERTKRSFGIWRKFLFHCCEFGILCAIKKFHSKKANKSNNFFRFFQSKKIKTFVLDGELEMSDSLLYDHCQNLKHTNRFPILSDMFPLYDESGKKELPIEFIYSVLKQFIHKS